MFSELDEDETDRSGLEAWLREDYSIHVSVFELSSLAVLARL